jgi:hypothetical protein
MRTSLTKKQIQTEIIKIKKFGQENMNTRYPMQTWGRILSMLDDLGKNIGDKNE